MMSRHLSSALEHANGPRISHETQHTASAPTHSPKHAEIIPARPPPIPHTTSPLCIPPKQNPSLPHPHHPPPRRRPFARASQSRLRTRVAETRPPSLSSPPSPLTPRYPPLCNSHPSNPPLAHVTPTQRTSEAGPLGGWNRPSPDAPGGGSHHNPLSTQSRTQPTDAHHTATNNTSPPQMTLYHPRSPNTSPPRRPQRPTTPPRTRHERPACTPPPSEMQAVCHSQCAQ